MKWLKSNEIRNFGLTDETENSGLFRNTGRFLPEGNRQNKIIGYR